MKIVLLRHGKPKMSKFNKMTGIEFGDWIHSYNSAPLCDQLPPASDAISIAKSCNSAVCSTLPRSIESGQWLGLNNKASISSDFVEAGLPNFGLKNFRFSEKFWSTFFRVSWFLGYAPNCESFSQAKRRARRCSEHLVSSAKDSDSLIFVGHGILNRLVSKELIANGWDGPHITKSTYWQYSVYQYES